MKINVHIERLVIDEALLRGERAADVGATLERDLARLLATAGGLDALPGIGAVDRLPMTSLPVAGHPCARLGARVATAIAQALGADGVSAMPTRNAAIAPSTVDSGLASEFAQAGEHIAGGTGRG